MLVMDRFRQSHPEEGHVTSQRKQTLTVFFFFNILAEQLFYGQKQGTHALNFKTAGFGWAAQEYNQAARDEVHVAVAQVAEMSRAKMRTVMGALANQSEQTWTYHPVMLSDEMNSVAGDALEKPEKKFA